MNTFAPRCKPSSRPLRLLIVARAVVAGIFASGRTSRASATARVESARAALQANEEQALARKAAAEQAQLEYQRVEDIFAFLSFQKVQIMIEKINRHWDTGKLEYPFGRGINLQIEADDVEKLAQRLEKENYPLPRRTDRPHRHGR